MAFELQVHMVTFVVCNFPTSGVFFFLSFLVRCMMIDNTRLSLKGLIPCRFLFHRYTTHYTTPYTHVTFNHSFCKVSYMFIGCLYTSLSCTNFMNEYRQQPTVCVCVCNIHTFNKVILRKLNI